MSIFEAIILGLVQGLTEFIPVSSSGHLLIVHEIFGSSDNSLAFDVALHVGTLAALLVYFRDDLLRLAKNLAKDNADGKLAKLLIVATIPAAAAGLLLADYIDDNLRNPTVVAITLTSVGVLMLIAESKYKQPTSKAVSTKQGMTVGFMQMLALIPGVSRSGITMTSGMFAGMTRLDAARFSFLLAIPIIAGSAAGVLLKDGGDISTESWQLAVGVVTAFISGLIAIKFLLGIIGKSGLKPFAYYRIALAAVVLMFLV
jgi:undecaprenyl-diphosphatase